MEQDYNLKKWSKGCPNTGVNCRRSSCGIEYVFIPAALGDDQEGSPVAPKNGSYNNAIVYYEATGNVYLYSSDGVPTRVEKNLDSIIAELQRELNDVEEALSEETSAREAADAAIEQEIEDLRNEPDVVDIVGTYAELQAYDTSDLGDKDIIRVLVDEMHDNESTYYRWNKTPQTWTYIGAVEGYYTRGQTDALLDEKQDTLTAGANVQINNNVISATDTTYTHFTGATASTDGVQGLVPGPLAGDEAKFLKADGTWGGIAIDGQITTLTADDYNWNSTAGDDTTLPLDSIALWKLAPGWYRTDIGMQVLRYKTTDYSYCPKDAFILVLGDAPIGPATTIPNYVFRDGDVSVALPMKNTGVLFEKAADKSVAFTSILGEMYQASIDDYNWNSQTQSQINPDCFAIWKQNLDTHPKTITNSSTHVQIQEYKGGPLVNGAKSPVYLRSMRVGSNPINMFKIDSDGAYRITTGSGGTLLAYETLATIDDIDNRILTSAGAPTTSTVGTVGQILEDTTNGKLYICTDATNPYVWEEVGSGGGGGATIFYIGSGLIGRGEDVEAPLFYKDSSYQTPATASEMYAACMTGPVYICSNQSDDLLYTEIVAMSNYSTNYTFSLTDVEHVLGYDCTINSYISSGTEYYSFDYNEPVSINVVQTTGSSTTNVMSQNAATNMVFPNNDTQRVQIGAGASTVAYTQGVAIGRNARARSTTTVAIGTAATAEDVSGVAIGNLSDAAEPNSVALGGSAVTSRSGEVNVGTGRYNYGYNSTPYRVIGGVHDGQTAHDVATVGQLNGRVLTSAGAPTTSTVGTVGQLYEDTTNGKLYICTDATNPYVWEEVGSGGGGGGETMLVTLTKTTIGQYSNVWVWSSDYTFAQLTANPEAIRVFVNDWCYESEGNIKPTYTKVETFEQSTKITLARDLAGVEMSFVLNQPRELEGQTVNPAFFDVTNFVDENKTLLTILPTLTLADNATYIPDGTTITLQTPSSDKEMYGEIGSSDCYPHKTITNGNFMILPVRRKVGSGESYWVEEECLIVSVTRRGEPSVADSYIYKTFMFNGEYYKMALTNSSYPNEVYTITKIPGGH